MNTIDTVTTSNIVNKNVLIFQREIASICQIDCKKAHTEKSDFPLFHPANQDYFEFKYYENHLEWYIRDFLITPILCELFTTRGIQVYTPPKDKRVHFKYSNESFGDDYPFAFIISADGKNIGIRYSGVCLIDREAKQQLKKLGLDHVEIIDWDDTDSIESKKEEYGVSPELREKYLYYTLRGFFIKYFSDEIYSNCLGKIRAAVEQANVEIGFHTIPNLSLRYLSDFKYNVFVDLSGMPLWQLKYQRFDDNGEPSGEFYNLLPEGDCEVLRRRFAEEGLIKSLIGNEKFAKCFLTSEYLYQVFQKGNEKSFDYSAVATGYFKSVELLLKRILDLALNCKGHDDLWIKCNYIPKGQVRDNLLFRKNPNRKAKGNQAKFIKENEKTFSTEMGPLIWFIHDRADGWYVSQPGQEIVHNCLINYNKGCRNEHLHKDIINEIETIKSIRENTILCLFYLLGGCQFTDTPEMDGFSLGIESNEFDRMYKTLLYIPRGENCFYIQFEGQEEIKVIRLYDQEAPQYDAKGNIQSQIRFAIVDSFEIGDYKAFLAALTEENELYLSRDSIPESIWRYNKFTGRVKIEW